MARQLEGKVALVTGAGHGIGREVAVELAARGARVVVNDLGSGPTGEGSAREPAEQTVAMIKDAGGQATANFGDVSSREDAERMVGAAQDQFGRLDILINVAGIGRESAIVDMTEEDWDDVVRVHMKGTFNTSQLAGRIWRDQPGGGRLINFSSGAGVHGTPGLASYAAAKAGIIGFTVTCAAEFAGYGVTANVICPVAWTRLYDWWFEARQTSGRPVTQEELSVQDRGETLDNAGQGTERDPANVVPIVAYLASDQAANVTGRVFNAGGRNIGLYARPRVEQTLYTDGPWDIDRLFEVFPQTFGMAP